MNFLLGAVGAGFEGLGILADGAEGAEAAVGLANTARSIGPARATLSAGGGVIGRAAVQGLMGGVRTNASSR